MNMILGINNKMAHKNTKNNLFELVGKRCDGCREYCLKCFQVECIVCKQDNKSKPHCRCSMINGLIEEKVDEAKYIMISQNATSFSIDITMNYYLLLLHEGIDVYMKVVLQKTFEDTGHVNEALVSELSKRDNYVELKFYVKEGCHQLRKRHVIEQKATLKVPMIHDPKLYALYCGEGKTKRHETCADHLNRILERRDIRFDFTNDLPKTLKDDKGPLLVISLIHSRPSSDVATTLSTIEKCYYGRVILVLLHFKQGDFRKAASEIIELFKVFEAVDYFVKQDSDNINNVADTVWKAIDNYKKQHEKNLDGFLVDI